MSVSASAKRILIVDDNEVVLDILREFLSPAYAVDAAATVTAAVDQITATPPEATFLDVKLPGTDGLTLLGSLRRAGITVPIFVTTGYDSLDVAEEATRRGATGYLAKPVDLRRLDRLIADPLGVPPLLNKWSHDGLRRKR